MYVPFFTKGDIFSNFYECFFEIDGRQYCTTEQYLFSKKAIFVGDQTTADKIMRNRDARQCKLIGEQSVPWTGTLEEWRAFATDKLRVANMAKYSQNENLRRSLFATSPKILVETNPTDHFWGIGLKKGDKEVQDAQKWRGKNQMGFLLTDVRDELMKDPKMAIIRKRSYDMSPESFTTHKRSSINTL